MKKKKEKSGNNLAVLFKDGKNSCKQKRKMKGAYPHSNIRRGRTAKTGRPRKTSLPAPSFRFTC